MEGMMRKWLLLFMFILWSSAAMAAVVPPTVVSTLKSDDVITKGPVVDIRSFMTAAQIADVTTGAGNVDVAGAVQSAIDYCAVNMGHALFFPRGRYRIASTLHITSRGQHWVGEFGQRGDTTNKGSQLYFVGSGSCIELGSDDGIAWDSATDYNGPQGAVFENLSIYNNATNRTTALNGGGGNYAAGSYGIRDWRGGDIRLRNVSVEGFEYNFWGIKSDFDTFTGVTSLYSKYGIYLGPRSDQATIYDLYSFSCDHAVTVDGAAGLTIYAPKIVICGSTTDHAILIRRGSGIVTIEAPWFEYMSGAQIQIAFVGAGTEVGYAGNDNYTLSTVINNPFIATGNPGGAGSVKYLVEIGKARDVVVNNPVAGAGITLTTNLLYVGAFSAGLDHSTTNSSLRFTAQGQWYNKVYTNLGTGTPSVFYNIDDSGNNFGTATGRFAIRTPGASAGADQLRFSQESRAGAIYVTAPTYATGQTNRVTHWRAFRQEFTVAPGSGTWEQGDWSLNILPTPGSIWGWVNTATGTPGTHTPLGVIAGVVTNGDVSVSVQANTAPPTQVWASPLTTTRTVTLVGGWSGAKFRIVRTAASTGVSTLNVGSGPLKSLAAGQWCEVEHDGSNWILTAFGSL